jgi:hypothetical protein
MEVLRPFSEAFDRAVLSAVRVVMISSFSPFFKSSKSLSSVNTSSFDFCTRSRYDVNSAAYQSAHLFSPRRFSFSRRVRVCTWSSNPPSTMRRPWTAPVSAVLSAILGRRSLNGRRQTSFPRFRQKKVLATIEKDTKNQLRKIWSQLEFARCPDDGLKLAFLLPSGRSSTDRCATSLMN